MDTKIGVIFDFNGTCIFDGKLHNQAWRSYIEELTMRQLTDRDEDAFIKQRTPKEILEHFVGYQLSDSMVNQFSEEKERLYRALLKKDDPGLAPGLEEFLNFLTLAQVPKAIATTTNLENMNFYFENYMLDRWFPWDKVIVGAGNIPLKPNPDLYLAAMNKLKMTPDQIVAFEDSPSGVEAAYRAGIRHIIVVTGDSFQEALRMHDGVYAVVKDFTELTAENFA